MPEFLTWSNQADLIAALARRAQTGEDCPVEDVPLYGANLEERLRGSGPAVLDLGAAGFLGLLQAGKRTAVTLAPDLSIRRVPLNRMVDTVFENQAPADVAEADRLLASCRTSRSRRPAARRAILRQRLHSRRLGTLHVVSTDPGTSFPRQLREAGLLRTLPAFAAAHTAETLLWLAIWWAAGQAALTGRVDSGWMLGWALLLAALVPARVCSTWLEGRLSIGASGLLKQRLLAGALRVDSSQVAHDGAGRFFSRMAEASMVESLALSGGLTAAVSVVETLVAALVLSRGVNGGFLTASFAVWLVLAAVLIWRGAQARARWTQARIGLTHDFVEQAAGHRTRLAQEPPGRRHLAEDAALDRYLALSARMDRWNVAVTAFVPSGWLVLGVAGLLSAFAAGANAADLAIALGGVLLAQQALARVTAGASSLAGAAISWQCVAPLFRAARKTETARSIAAPPARTVADAADIVFRHPDGPRPVLDGVNLRIERGDWVLLEGESGKGKSTLVSILAGLREPNSGLLTSGGLDRRSLGAAAWRQRVAAAPQFHENHVLTGTLAFNLLLGRAWPPSRDDLAEAAQICRELGLDGLLERMPGGLEQMVGETGWQLSQGERSRVFLARALLQQSEMVILDESFAALDPENLRRAMECVLRRAKTLLVVAHP